MKNRREEIKKKGFAMQPERNISEVYVPNSVKETPFTDFSKIKVGIKTLDDAIFNLGELKKINPRLADKETVLRAIQSNDIITMREISNFFYKTSGIYSRLCRYMAYLYRHDWMITPYINGCAFLTESSIKDEKVIEGFNKALLYLDNFEVKRFFGEVALKVLRNGCYYGYLVPQTNKMVIQELPASYCRSRFQVNNRPAIEFNMRYFDDAFTDTTQRMKILNLFPEEFKKGYHAYRLGKLTPDFAGDTSGWYLLDVEKTIKFNINGDDYPFLIAVIPAIIDLDEAQELDRKKMAQKLLKIIIQKMPLDKNGELIFDVDEAQQLHNNAVRMLGKAIGLDVLTTFADVEVANMEQNNATAEDDSMDRVKQAIYDQAGVSQLQFNSDGNIALNNSILNDEASMYNLLVQFESFLNDLLKPFNKSPKKILYKAQILTTTIYNYKEMAKLYKEQTQLGYSKMLPQIALGQSQSSILANAYFENEILSLSTVFIPPLMSSTMNSDTLKSVGSKKVTGGNETSIEGNGEVGRNEKADNEKSEKTIANRESMS